MSATKRRGWQLKEGRVIATAESLRKAGRISGQQHYERGTGIFSLSAEQQSEAGRKGGKIAGRKTASIPGHMARAGRIGGKIGGHVQGLRNAANGHLKYCLHIKWHVIAGKEPRVYCRHCGRGKRNSRWQGNRLVKK